MSDPGSDVLTYDKLVEAVKPFDQQKSELNELVGFSFNASAWSLVNQLVKKKDTDLPEPPGVILGVKCYVITGQLEECIGWRDQKALDVWVEVNGDMDKFVLEMYGDHLSDGFNIGEG